MGYKLLTLAITLALMTTPISAQSVELSGFRYSTALVAGNWYEWEISDISFNVPKNATDVQYSGNVQNNSKIKLTVETSVPNKVFDVEESLSNYFRIEIDGNVMDISNSISTFFVELGVSYSMNTTSYSIIYGPPIILPSTYVFSNGTEKSVLDVTRSTPDATFIEDEDRLYSDFENENGSSSFVIYKSDFTIESIVYDVGMWGAANITMTDSYRQDVEVDFGINLEQLSWPTWVILPALTLPVILRRKSTGQ